MTFSSINPANGMLLRTYEALTPEAVTTKIGDAQQAFLQYRDTTLEHRELWMKKLAGILEQEMEELATLLTTEVGQTITASREEILQCAACCRYYGENAAALLADEAVEIDASECLTTWHPRGVLLAILPGTGTFWQVLRCAVPALLGGNVVLLKHSSGFPQCAVELEMLVRRAGFARGVFQTLLMDDADVESLLNDTRIAGVALAGTQKTTREIAAHSMWMGKKVAVENDRSSVMIVTPSANLFAAIQAGVKARCVGNGQSSASTGHFLVQDDVYDDFTMLFTAAMEDVKIGNPLKDETELGPLAAEADLQRLRAQIAKAVAAGGRVLTGGERMLGEGNYFEPTVIVDVPHDATMIGEPIQGPVAFLFRVESLDAAVTMANNAAADVSVWTQDVEEQKQFSRRLAAGKVFLNSPMITDARIGAGCGKSMAAARLHDFMTTRTFVMTEAIPGEEFNFGLALEGFDEESAHPDFAEAEMVEAEAAAQAVLDQDEVTLEADVFVASHEMESSAAVGVLEAVEVQASVAVSDEVNVPVTECSLECIAPPVAIGSAEEVQAEVATTPAAISFKEMFERALQVRA